jgi:hypothetical protein
VHADQLSRQAALTRPVAQCHERSKTVSDENQEQDVIVARLDTLIDAVNRLTDAVLAGAETLPPAPVALPEPAAAAASPVPVPTASVPAPTAAATAATSGDVEVVVDDHVVSGIPGAGADIRATLSRMFQAALVKDQEVAWRELTALTHPREMAAPRALDGLKAFSWKQLRKNAASYLSEGKTDSFSVVRTDPGELSGDEERVKVFLQSTGRSPAPVTLRRDDSSGGAWRLGQVSI